MDCHSTILALNMYNNRAAAYQQLGQHTQALSDSLFVIRYDAANAKALARAEKARAQGARTKAELADAEAAIAEATEALAASRLDGIDPLGGSANASDNVDVAATVK